MRGSHRRYRRRRQAAGVALAFTGLLVSFLLTLGQLGLIAASAADGSSGFDGLDTGKTSSTKFDSAGDRPADSDNGGDTGGSSGGGNGSSGGSSDSSGTSDGAIARQRPRVSTTDPNPDCGGVFEGNPGVSLTKTASSGGTALADGADVVVGQSITYTITWDTDDWNPPDGDLDKIADCFFVDGPGSDPDVSSLNAGEKPTDNDGTFSHTITVPNTLTAGEDQLCDRARLSDPSTTVQVDTQKSNVLCFDVVAAPPPSIDVAISKGPATQSINDGGTATFDITVTNTGNAQATGVTVTDTLPSGLTPATVQFGATTSSLGNCTNPTPISGQTVTCNVGNLAAGSSVVVRITATETGSLCQYQNSASVTASNETGTTSNNTSGPVTVTVNCAVDVTISKSPSTQSVNDGGTATFDITVTNLGNQQATNVVVTDTLPSGLTPATVQFGATTSSLGNCTNATPISGQTVTCNVGNLAAGASVVVRITATETGSLCQYQNTASVSASNETTGTAANNTSGVVTVNVNNCAPPPPPPPGQPSLSLNKAGSATVTNGGAVTYTVTVTNSGSAAATSVVITDNLDDAFTFVTASSTIGTCSVGSGNVVTCNVGTLNAGQSATITINATTPAGTCPTITNQATGTHAGGAIPSSGTVTTTVTGCVTPPPEISVLIEKTNDADEDGIFTNNEEAKTEDRAVDFHLVITNTSGETVEITDLTDSFEQTTIDLLVDECPALDGAILDPGESVECTFRLPNYSPDSEADIVNVAEVCVIMVGDTPTACDTNPSRVTTAEVLGRTVTPTSPPPTTTPPGGIAFTGPAAVVPLAGLALLMLTIGSGLLWAGRRRPLDDA